LRIDIASKYETVDYLSELLDLANSNFFGLFGAKIMAVKAIPEATERITALKANGFVPYEMSNPNFTHFLCVYLEVKPISFLSLYNVPPFCRLRCRRYGHYQL
jgi:hypothetical protein